MNNEIAKIPIYCRVASDPEGFALEAQIANAKYRANDVGLEGEYIVFSDVGPAVGVPMTDRKGLMDCLNYIKENNPPYLFVWKRDRLARDVNEYINIVKTIKKYNTEIVFSNPGEKPFGEGDYAKLQELLINNIGEIERQFLRQRILNNRKAQVLSGDAMIVTPPYGYIYNPDNKSYEIDDNQALVVREIFDLYLSTTMDAGKIAEFVNKKGVSSRSGKSWSKQSIINILRNPFYMGCQRLSYIEHTDNGEVRVKVIQASDKISPLISKEKFEAVQAILDRYSRQRPNRI